MHVTKRRNPHAGAKVPSRHSKTCSFMANVLQPHIEFPPCAVSHAPSPFGFGFGLGGSSAASAMSSVAWPATTPGHTNHAAFQQLASSVSQSSRAQKRRLEPDEDAEPHSRFTGQRDESMDRSPTPERPKRSAPKRVKVAPTNSSSKDAKENKAPNNDDDVDVGVLLGEDFS